MRRLVLIAIAFFVGGSFLAADLAEAMPARLFGGPTIDQQTEGTQVARRRRKPQRRRKKPKPKPVERAAETAPAAEPTGDAGGAAIPSGAGGRSRVDFDAMNIKGQTTKAGEVQILERKDTELKSMVKRRTSFREEIILSVFPEKAGSLK